MLPASLSAGDGRSTFSASFRVGEGKLCFLPLSRTVNTDHAPFLFLGQSGKRFSVCCNRRSCGEVFGERLMELPTRAVSSARAWESGTAGLAARTGTAVGVSATVCARSGRRAVKCLN